MSKDPILPTEEFPTIAKVQALKLPMKTIKDFLEWLQKDCPDKLVSDLDATLLVYRYYNVEVEALVNEMASAQQR